MKVCLALLAIILCFSTQAQTNILTGNLAAFNISGRTNVTMTMQIVSPKKRTVNNILISDDAIPTCTDTNSNFSFTNVIFGKYSLTAGDSSSTTWILYVGTNTLGNVPLASLITNSAAIPPNPATNFYTAAQIDAKFSTFSGGSGGTNSTSLTNTTWGVSPSEATNKLQIIIVYTNGGPWYSVLKTNL